MARLSDAELARIISRDFKGERAVTAFAVVLAESGGDEKARNVNSDGSVDRGLWQINSRWHPEVFDSCAYNAGCATRSAQRISGGGRNFSPWVAYKTGAHAKYIPRARTALKNPAADPERVIPGVKTGLDVVAASSPWQAFEDVARFFGALINPETWFRVAEVIGGLILIIAGIWVLSKDSLPPGMRRFATK